MDRGHEGLYTFEIDWVQKIFLGDYTSKGCGFLLITNIGRHVDR